MSRRYKELVVQPVCGAAGYVANDSFGGLNLLEDAVRTADGFTEIRCVTITDKSENLQAADVLLIFFEDNPAASTFTDSSPLNVADADVHKINGTIRIYTSDWEDMGDSAEATVGGNGLIYTCDATKTLRMAIKLLGAITSPANGDVQVRLGVDMD